MFKSDERVERILKVIVGGLSIVAIYAIYLNIVELIK